jgi:fructose-bisphosphate aldolase class I
MDKQQIDARIRDGKGFIAALDQSGGSTPKALAGYGIASSAWTSDEEMFDLIHRMRCRVISSPAFSGDKILGAILFERTMDGEVDGTPVPQALLDRGVIPFLKVDQGLEEERNGVQLMKPIAGLDALLERAKALGVYGTKMRSVIKADNRTGIAEIVAQQFEVGKTIADAGLMPILEPEYDIKAADRAEGEAFLRGGLLDALARLPGDRQVMLKLSIPATPGLYGVLVRHPRVARVVALSGGYSRAEACRELARNEGMVASFSRALLSDLRADMSDEEFDAALGTAIDEIYEAGLSG